MNKRLLLPFILLLGLAACDGDPAPQEAAVIDQGLDAEVETLAPALASAIRELMDAYLNRIDVELADASNNFQRFGSQVESFLNNPQPNSSMPCVSPGWLRTTATRLRFCIVSLPIRSWTNRRHWPFSSCNTNWITGPSCPAISITWVTIPRVASSTT
jgi:hypothetical protein